MKKLFIVVGVLIFATSTLNAQELKLEEVLEKHFKASGFDKLQDVKTIIMSGTMTTHVVMPIIFYRVRPNKYRMERDVNDITGFTVFDGQTGWTTAPWSKNPLPQVATGQTLVDLQNSADFDGAIYDWKTKGHTAELTGKEKTGDTEAYKVRLTLKTGAIEYYLIDCNSFLLQSKLSFRIIKEKEVEIKNNFSDYRIIDGITFAFTNENFMDGQPYSTIQFDSIELNNPVDEQIFVMKLK